jgi:hypothetical protein
MLYCGNNKKEEMNKGGKKKEERADAIRRFLGSPLILISLRS